MRALRGLPYAGALALLAAGCSGEHGLGQASLTQASSVAPARITMRLAPGQFPAAVSAGLAGSIMRDKDPNDSARGFVRVDTADVDSLVVTVTKVEIREREVADSQGGGRDSTRGAPAGDHGDHGCGPLGMAMGGRCGSSGDSAQGSGDRGRNGDEGMGRGRIDGGGWLSLSVIGSGHINLLGLPTSPDTGLVVAADSVPPGEYEHLRLFVTGPTIFFRTTIVTSTGDTLRPGVAYPVTIPSADSSGAAMRTDESFTVPTGGGNVAVFFDKDDTLRRIVITGNGTIIVPPLIR
jgi:hypothetical protein